jgi:hypothetical protein
MVHTIIESNGNFTFMTFACGFGCRLLKYPNS